MFNLITYRNKVIRNITKSTQFHLSEIHFQLLLHFIRIHSTFCSLFHCNISNSNISHFLLLFFWNEINTNRKSGKQQNLHDSCVAFFFHILGPIQKFPNKYVHLLYFQKPIVFNEYRHQNLEHTHTHIYTKKPTDAIVHTKSIHFFCHILYIISVLRDVYIQILVHLYVYVYRCSRERIEFQEQ